MTVFAITSISGAMITSQQGFVIGGVSAPGVSPRYLLLEDHYIGGVVYLAGTIVSEDDALPYNWQPTPNVDPLNTNAVNNFYAAGVRLPGLIRTQWTSNPVPRPVTYWKNISGGNRYVLTGLGANLPPRVG